MAENEQMVFSSVHRNKSGTTLLPSFNLSKCPNYDPAKARFLILNSTEKKLSTVSPFLVQKSLESSIGNPKNVKQLPSGDLLVETTSEKQTTSLLKTHKIGNIPITVTPHNTLNISKGVISDKALQSLPIEEILEGLSDQGVIDARHITIKKGSEIINTQHLILTFNTAQLPTDVKAGYRNCKIRPYIPNPIRCFKCQKFGHSTSNCRGNETCSRCSQPDHNFKTCSLPEKCVNCTESHSANSRNCPKWKQEKQILNIKVTQNLTYFEAKAKLLGSQPKPNLSYAAVVAKKSSKSMGIQYDSTEIDPQSTKLKILSPSKTSVKSKSISSQVNQQNSNTSKLTTTQSKTPCNTETSKYLKLTPQMVNVLHKKLSQSPVISKQKYIPKSRQNKFKFRPKAQQNTQQPSSDAMSTEEENSDDPLGPQMQIDDGLETPTNLLPKSSKLKIKR
ncbi:uncharacterized protein [Parasteatoda tepidariorum]|uniref:uncharacterized protein n=1 Tax=Parasteatoda tepidariorum TaxID=114398 RepID=UPI0039BD7AB4